VVDGFTVMFAVISPVDHKMLEVTCGPAAVFHKKVPLVAMLEPPMFAPASLVPLIKNPLLNDATP